jgi:hypothetical protein
MILRKAAKQLANDWKKQCHYRPVLFETFVEKSRFAGTCYKAVNWTYLGQTQGHGKLGVSVKQSVPIKDLWIYPLNVTFRQCLTN